MRFSSYLLVPLIVGTLLALMNREARRAEKDMDVRHFVVRQSKLVVWIGIIGAAFFGALLILMTLSHNETATWWVYLIFSLFLGLSSLLAIYGIIWRLEVTNDVISFTAPFHKKSAFTFGDITKVKAKSTHQYEQVIAYAGRKRLFAVESNCKGYSILIARLKQEQVKFESSQQ